MRSLIIFALVLLAGCNSPGEPEVFTTSVNVDETSVMAVLTAVDQLTENDIDIERLLTLTETTKMDDEQQLRFAVTFKGEETDILYHVWREQEAWVHLYASSESESLVSALQAAFAPFAREGD
jgi:hypothetical protein